MYKNKTKYKKDYKWKPEEMTPGRKVLRPGELATLMGMRCKEFNEALQDGIVTMHELRAFALEHELNFKQGYIEMVIKGELFPPKEISEYIRRKRDNQGRDATRDAVIKIKEHRVKSKTEVARLARRARAMSAQAIINNTESFLANNPEYFKLGPEPKGKWNTLVESKYINSGSKNNKNKE